MLRQSALGFLSTPAETPPAPFAALLQLAFALILVGCGGDSPTEGATPDGSAPAASGPRPLLPSAEEVTEIAADALRPPDGATRQEIRNDPDGLKPKRTVRDANDLRWVMGALHHVELSWTPVVAWPVGPGRCSLKLTSSQPDRFVTIRDDMIMALGDGGQLSAAISEARSLEICKRALGLF